ncbi:hypothetical protein N7476_000278 [Penicillium atrosanguineum]|uniref:Uncharacterized protein n=1 Tax=Penicillium atrosanguineum TaxID=1132637 RepID=A0A9W9QBC9_9EURO|nr:hypothetical protein N7476_000278 [Penicillium atrosanguineum]
MCAGGGVAVQPPDRFHRSVIKVVFTQPPPSTSRTVNVRSPSSLTVVTHRRHSPSSLTVVTHRRHSLSLTISTHVNTHVNAHVNTHFCSFYASMAHAFYCGERAVGPQTIKASW